MKKYLSLIAIFAVAAIACNKVDESQVLEPENEAVAGTNLVSFSVNLPDFVNADTKASISDAGAFSWETGDAIYVLCCKEDKENTFHQVPFTYNTENGKFECSFPATVTYPGGTGTVTVSGITRVATPEEANADGRPLAVYPDPRSVENLYRYTDAQKFIKMKGSLNSTTGAIDFVHESALVNIHIANVPSFASYFTVSGGKDLVTVNFDGETPSEVNKTVPITPAGSASDIVITLYDSADNIIISKKKSDKTLVAGNLYDTPQIAVGPIILIKNNVMSEKGENSWTEIDAASGRINLHTYISGEKDFTSYDNSNCQFNELIISGNPYVYYVYPANYAGREVHVNLRCLGYDYPKLETDIVISGVSEYSFGFAQGLKKSNDKFIYAMFEGSDTAKCKVYVEDGGSAVFGSWWDTNPTQAVVMYNDGSEKRFLNIYDITSCSPSATFEPIENGNKYYMYDWSWATKVAFSDANGISDYYLIYKWEDPDHHVYNKDFAYLANLVY